MSVTLTNGDVLAAKAAVEQLLRIVMPAQTAMKIRRIARDLYDTASEVELEYQKISDRFSQRGPDGQIQFDMIGGQRQARVSDQAALLLARTELLDKTMVEVEPLPISVLKIANSEEFKPSILLDMGDWLKGNVDIVGKAKSIRVRDIVPTANGIYALCGNPMSLENATKLWRIYAQLRAASKIATAQRNTLVDRYARRDGSGSIIYLDKAVDRVDVDDEFFLEEVALLESMIHVDGIDLDFLLAVEEKHRLTGNVCAALHDIIILEPDGEGAEDEDRTS